MTGWLAGWLARVAFCAAITTRWPVGDSSLAGQQQPHRATAAATTTTIIIILST